MTRWSVYCLFDSAGTALYVGFSADSALRLAQHTRTAEWWDRVATATLEHFGEDKRGAMGREADLIRELRPLFNVRHNPGHRQRPLGLVEKTEAA